MYGKTYWGVQRATFVIDADGGIAKVFPEVSPKTHDDVVLDARLSCRRGSGRAARRSRSQEDGVEAGPGQDRRER